MIKRVALQLKLFLEIDTLSCIFLASIPIISATFISLAARCAWLETLKQHLQNSGSSVALDAAALSELTVLARQTGRNH